MAIKEQKLIDRICETVNKEQHKQREQERQRKKEKGV